ncbi:MAG: hypothetical protein HY868_03700 [Chloroflexi bacterium]|nr:hypothetical protein [Chloroflexota bacterium]
MGLMIHSLGELPDKVERGYFIYLLDYGWDEPLGETLQRNFAKMAELASPNDAIVLKGTVGSHFEDEVLSWHHVNGQPGDQLLPAILITARHPNQFRNAEKQREPRQPTDRMILIPLRKTCKSSSDVVLLIEKVFKDIREKKSLSDFQIAREMSKGQRGAIVDALILQPNISGVGINLNYIIDFLIGKKQP